MIEVNGIYAIAMLPDGLVLVGCGNEGVPEHGLGLERYRPDPAPLGSSATFAGGINGEVRAILPLPSGAVWVGGAHSGSGAAAANNIITYATPVTLPAFSRQTAPMLIVVGGTAVFDLSASALGEVTCRWQREGVPLGTIAHPTTATPTLRLSNLHPSDAGSYVCVVTGSCNGLSVGSLPAALTFPGPPCPADINGDAFVDFFDFDEFVAAFEAGC